MNRRSAFKVAIGACAAMLFPWRGKVAGKPKSGIDYWVKRDRQLVDQVERIKRLFPNDCIPNCPRTTSYRATVQRRRSEPRIIEIWWDDDEPDDSGRYGCGLVMLTEDLAASLDDKTLSEHLLDAFLMAISDGHVVRLELLEGFKGMAICITRYSTSDRRQGVFVTPALYTQSARIRGDINTLGGLSKT